MHPGPADGIGAIITLAANGLDVLRTLGVATPVVAAGQRPASLPVRGTGLSAPRSPLPRKDEQNSSHGSRTPFADDTDADGLPAALSSMYSLGRDRVVALLTLRLGRLAATIDADDALSGAEAHVENPIFLTEHHYQLARRRAQRDWLESYTTALGAGSLTWPARGSGLRLVSRPIP